MTNESNEQALPVYSSIHDEDQFKLVTLSIEWNDNKNPWIKRTPCSLLKISQELWEIKMQMRETGEVVLFFSWLILLHAEDHQRKLLKRIIHPTSRNIRLTTKTTVEYLQQSIFKIKCDYKFPYSIYPHMSLNDKKDLIPKISKEKLKKILDKVFADAKLHFGFPEINPYEYSYKVTSEVVSKAQDDNCIKFLNQHRPREIISVSEFEDICETLEMDYIFDAEAVIKALGSTKSRDHIAAFSITTEREQTFVSIANEQGKFIKMESWKFLSLIDNAGESRRLHEFVKKRMNDPPDSFELNNNKDGEVYAKFDPQQCTIDILCIGAKPDDYRDRATFIVDTDYILCVYTTLNRLEEDRERFNKMRNQATTSKPLKDPFESLPNPFL